mgnify:CR=1 FL=1
MLLILVKKFQYRVVASLHLSVLIDEALVVDSLRYKRQTSQPPTFKITRQQNNNKTAATNNDVWCCHEQFARIILSLGSKPCTSSSSSSAASRCCCFCSRCRAAIVVCKHIYRRRRQKQCFLLQGWSKYQSQRWWDQQSMLSFETHGVFYY